MNGAMGAIDYADVPVDVGDPDAYLAEMEQCHRALTAIRSGPWLDAQNFPPLTFAVPGLIPEGTTLLAGPPKVGKSWLALSMALSVAVGGRALGVLPVNQRTVLYMGLEDGDRRMQARIRSLIPGDPIPEKFNYLTRPAESVRTTIRAWLREHADTGLIVVDVLAKVAERARPGESQYAADYRSVGQFQELMTDNPGASLLIVHHTRKAGSDDFIDASSGTQGLSGAADAIGILSRDRHSNEGLIAITGRDVDEHEYGLRREASGGWRLAGDNLEIAREAASHTRTTARLGRQGDRMREIVQFVNSRESTTPRDVAIALNLTNKEAGTYLGRALDADLIDKAERGTYLPLGQTVESVEVLKTTRAFNNSTHTTPVPEALTS